MQFQFTPLREGRPHIRFRRRNEHLISIHAPPRGATEKLAQAYYDSLISIHAPPRGATPPLSTSLYTIVFQFTPLREGRPALAQRQRISETYFNSRPSARGDAAVDAEKKALEISIHAPPRGATILQKLFPGFLQYFNSRPSARGDALSRVDGRGSAGNFNSRPSARGDLWLSTVRHGTTYFNSRPSARGDDVLSVLTV